MVVSTDLLFILGTDEEETLYRPTTFPDKDDLIHTFQMLLQPPDLGTSLHLQERSPSSDKA